jgi:hypothetical protein
VAAAQYTFTHKQYTTNQNKQYIEQHKKFGRVFATLKEAVSGISKYCSETFVRIDWKEP